MGKGKPTEKKNRHFGSRNRSATFKRKNSLGGEEKAGSEQKGFERSGFRGE